MCIPEPFTSARGFGINVAMKAMALGNGTDRHFE